MGAREKLNSIIVWGCLILSSILGLTLHSAGAFWMTLIMSIGICFFAGGIRPQPMPAEPNRSRRQRKRPLHPRRKF